MGGRGPRGLPPGEESPREPPSRVGPYRLEGLLGRGGMGAVYRAWDTRLGRRVAIKRLLAGGEDGSEGTVTVDGPSPGPGAAAARRRARLRRGETRRLLAEARAAAALNHPSIVQVYDVLEDDTGAWLVMELVEGETLAAHLRRRGTLPLEEVARLGREVAEALAAAHGAGVIHRDLKTENVMVTPGGRVKVLDFGVAHRAASGAAPGEAPGEGFQGLPVVRGVAGTLRAMAPEQAAGRPIDRRADLFALGVLLVEAATGTSPFLSPSREETLERLLTQAPEPLPDALPEGFRALVETLLEKDPRRRPDSADQVARRLARWQGDGGSRAGAGGIGPGASRGLGEEGEPAGAQEALAETEGAWGERPLRPTLGGSFSTSRRPLSILAPLALLVLLAVGVVGLTRSLADLRGTAAPPPAALHVAALAPEGFPEEGGGGASLLPWTVRSAVLRGLAQIEGIAAIDQEPPEGLAPEDRVAVARALAADELLTSRLACDRERCRVTLARLRGEDGAVLWSRTLPILADRLLLATEAVAAAVTEAYPDRAAEQPPPFPVDGDTWRRHVELVGDFEASRDGDLEPLRARAAALREAAPTFVEAHLLEARMDLMVYRQSRREADLEVLTGRLAAAEALIERLGLAEGRSRWELLELEAQAAITSRRFEAATAKLEALAARRPGSAEVLALQGRLLSEAGDLDGALAAYRTAAELHPSWTRLLQLSNVAFRAGDIDLARESVAEALARQPASFYARSRLAQLELLYGDPARSARLYEELVARGPEAVELTNLGVARLLLRDYGGAVEAFRRAHGLDPEDPANLLNLADGLALSGRSAAAEGYYRQVLAQVPPATEDPQRLSMRAQALAHLGQRGAARETSARALEGAPGVPLLLLEASLVRTVIGDLDQGEELARRALEAGVEARWFELPWFDPLQPLV